VRIYTESSEETLRARKLLTQWAGDGSLSKEQYQRLEQALFGDGRNFPQRQRGRLDLVGRGLLSI
jgi:hypothetical protein